MASSFRHNSNDFITLWSIQPHRRLQELQDRAVLTASWSHVPIDFRRPYHFMTSAMQKRGLGCDAPLWAWYRYNGKACPRPDLRRSLHLPRGERGIMLTLLVPTTQVLLSQFEIWHYPLNGWHLSDSEYEEAELLAAQRSGQDTWPLINASWERIFDLEFGSVAAWGPHDERRVQACLPHIRAEWVQEVRHFTAR